MVREVLWYGSLLVAFLMLLGTGVYACLEPDGPGAGPMLMLMVFVLAFVVILVVTSVDVGLYTRAGGSGFITTAHELDRRRAVLDLSVLGDGSQLSAHVAHRTHAVHRSQHYPLWRKPVVAVADSTALTSLLNHPTLAAL